MSSNAKANSRNKKSTTVLSATKTKSIKNIRKKREEKPSSSKKQKKRTNLLRLCSEMNQYAIDANDKEIVKRFKTTITSSVTDDISKTSLMTILKKPEDININIFSENLQPYLKHYLFMINRSK